MHLKNYVAQWWQRRRRRQMVRNELDAFARINPDLYGDIGLFPHCFQDMAEQISDRRLGCKQQESDEAERPGSCR